MRISSTLFFQTGLNSIHTQQSDLMHIYQQVASGQRMITPADDPLAAAQAVNISQSQSLNARFEANRSVLNRNLALEETTLNSVTLLLQDVKTRLVEAGNGTMSDVDRATLGNVLKEARSNLLGLANATDGNGQYLFSGAQGNVSPFQEVGGKVSYVGDAHQRNIQADQTRQIAASDVGSDIFGRAAPGTRGYLTLADANNSGSGTIGKPSLVDPNGHGVGNTFVVEFTSATDYTVSVKDAAGHDVYQTSGAAFTPGQANTVSLPGGVQVEMGGSPAIGDKFTIEPMSAPAYMAYPTNVPGPSAAPVMGTPKVIDASKVLHNTSYQVSFNGTDYTVSYSDLDGNPVTNTATFDPATNMLSLPNEGLELYLGATPDSGFAFTIEPTADGVNTDLNIFDTLDGIIKALEDGTGSGEAQSARFQNMLATALQRIDVNYNNVLTVRSSVGARMNEVDALNANGAQRNLGYTNQLSKLEDVDYYSATAQLQLRASALEAAAMAFKKIQATSLFNMTQ
ncbi:flagellar hook-associated protein FlgL [Parapusillimonas granuli]|uniref:Flagellar hook-associated protein FlgL n=1 Tax=Parapusillimonas granuli TaxID=380911 RepID=A0A853FU47_9BURK|nr:flagellar hook-associated protein FlgL [Parapusillimonas granuli]MBB5213389.1 flagellar hook-associated protein 3 FlgL [Parapusillimonas granuli]NYT48228.1 flagellar hook-associated protein FlgL [Parapusillimonas granuli]